MSIKEYLRSELKVRRREYYHSLPNFGLVKIENKFIADIFSLPIFLSPSLIIGCYYSVRDEVPTIRLIETFWQREFKVTLPHIHRDLPMAFHTYHPGDQLEFATYSIPQPSQEAQMLTPDIIIVPILGFNRAGHRIGYGQGCYDRTLRAIRSKAALITIGLAFNCQEVSDSFAEEFDEALDWIITESEVIQCPTLMHVKRML